MWLTDAARPSSTRSRARSPTSGRSHLNRPSRPTDVNRRTCAPPRYPDIHRADHVAARSLCDGCCTIAPSRHSLHQHVLLRDGRSLRSIHRICLICSGLSAHPSPYVPAPSQVLIFFLNNTAPPEISPFPHPVPLPI